MQARAWLAPLLLLIVGVTHYGYEPASAWFGGAGYAARNIFYCLRGVEGVALFILVGILAKSFPVSLVCLWGLIEEGQTAACRIAKGISEPNKSYEPFTGLCGASAYFLGLIAAIAIAVHLADKLREGGRGR